MPNVKSIFKFSSFIEIKIIKSNGEISYFMNYSYLFNASNTETIRTINVGLV